LAIIADVLALVDATVTSVASDTYGGIVAAILPVVSSASILVVTLVGINIATQTVPLTYNNAISLFLRIVLVNVFLIFGNLNSVYQALTNAPAELGAGLLASLSGGSVPNLYAGLDDLYTRALDVGQAISQNGGYIAGALTSAFMFLIAATMATITIIVLSAAKIMLAVLIAIAPLAIACTLFKQSAPLFEAWVKLAIGFSFVPLLVAAMAGFTIATGQAVAPPALDSVETLGDAISFIVIMLLGAGLMVLVPNFAQSLAATNIGLAGIAASAALASRGTFQNAGGATTGAARGVATGGQSVAGSGSANRAGNAVGRAVRSSPAAAIQLAGKMKRG
jgi:type IV secretion system protein VirB6